MKSAFFDVSQGAKEHDESEKFTRRIGDDDKKSRVKGSKDRGQSVKKQGESVKKAGVKGSKNRGGGSKVKGQKKTGIGVERVLRHKKRDLLGLFLRVVSPGIEPGTQGFSVLCSTN